MLSPTDWAMSACVNGQSSRRMTNAMPTIITAAVAAITTTENDGPGVCVYAVVPCGVIGRNCLSPQP